MADGKAGAPEGNHNARRGTDWRDAIHYELAKVGREVDGEGPAYVRGMRKCAEQFIIAAQAGEPWAMKELGDRMDGKPTQGVELSDPEGNPLQTVINYIPLCQQSDK